MYECSLFMVTANVCLLRQTQWISAVLGAEVSSEIKCRLISPSQAAQTALTAL